MYEHMCLHNLLFSLKYSCEFDNSPQDVLYISMKNVSSGGFLCIFPFWLKLYNHL